MKKERIVNHFLLPYKSISFFQINGKHDSKFNSKDGVYVFYPPLWTGYRLKKGEAYFKVTISALKKAIVKKPKSKKNK